EASGVMDAGDEEAPTDRIRFAVEGAVDEHAPAARQAHRRLRAGLAADRIDREAHAVADGLLHLFTQWAIAVEENAIGAEILQFLDLLAAADNVDRAKALRLRQSNDHFAQGTPRRGLQEPLAG